MSHSRRHAVTYAASIAAAIVVIALIPTSSSANTAETHGDQAASTAKEIAHQLATSTNPQAAFKRLSETEQATLRDGMSSPKPVTVIDRKGRYSPAAAEKAMREAKRVHQTQAPAKARAMTNPSASGCWYNYWYVEWQDLGLNTGDSWMQLNWCAQNGQITNWWQSNVGCAGHYGASCRTKGASHHNVGWEVRSTRYYEGDFFGYNNTFCMQIRGGATGLYSHLRSSDAQCPL